MSEQIVTINAAPHSVELSRNASGGVAFAVKYYSATVEEALGKAREIFGALDATYPVQAKEKK